MAASTAKFLEKVVVVTGASSGIGAATAVKFAKHGATLSLTGRNEENLKKTALECASFVGKDKVLLTVGSLTNEKTVEDLVQRTVEKFGKLDVLVNNAGILERGSIEDTSLEQYDKVFDVNVRAVYHLTMLAVPHLVKSKGCVVNVSSVNGIRPFAGVLAYNMSKAAVDHMTRCVAMELAPKQVRVNCVNPGVVITEIQKRGGMSDEDYAKFLERSKETHPLGRPGQAEEVANAIAFLASDDASFTTGVTLSVDGGRHALSLR